MVDEDQTKEVKPTEEVKPLNPIERQEAVLKGMKAENDRYEKLVKDNQEAAATAMLGSSAGGHIEHKTEEQKQGDKVNAMADEIVNAFK